MPTRRLLLAALPTVLAFPVAAAVPVVTILGDSITAGLGLHAADALPAQLEAALKARGVAAKVRGAGVSGDTTAGGLARLDFSVQPDTTVCVVELGANDLLQGVDIGQTRANLTAIIRRLKMRGIAVVLAGGKAPSGTLGAYGRAFDALFGALAGSEHVMLAPDLLARVMHPNPAGAKIVAARLAPVVAKALVHK
jgi:acyl-CoA thioesterase-1